MPDRPEGGDQAEVEFKLAAVGPDPAGALAAVAALDVLAGHDLGLPTRHAIRDVYWDTADGALGQRRVTFRVREVDGQTRFTVKSGGGSERGLFSRRELELPADAAGWQAVRDELAGLGLALPGAPATPDPASWPAAAGLVATQDRATERIARLVSRGGVPVAELALDTTEYRFGARLVTYREVEIEQLAGAGTGSAARALGEALLAAMPGAFEPATMGKYARGLQIARQLGIQPSQPPRER